MDMTRRTAIGAGAAAALLPTAPQAAAPMATTQAPGFFRFKVGDYQVTAINDGAATRPTDGFIPNAPAGALQELLAQQFLPTDRFTISFTTLVVNTGSKLLLIDTGNGDMGAPTTGAWLANFRAAGFEPAQVDTVIISHFHGDHINGLRTKDGQLRFPQAEVKVPAPEWAFWTDDAKAAQAPAGLKGTFDNTRRVFGPMAKDVAQYQWGQEVAPGIAAVDANGHTPGHTAFAITSGTGRLLVLSDTTNDPTVFARRPEWSAVFDQDGPQAVVSRKKMLDMAAAEKMQVSFYHAPFPATGHIQREGGGYEMVPAAWRPTV